MATAIVNEAASALGPPFPGPAADAGSVMPRYSNGTRWWRVGEVCTTKKILPAAYELPAGGRIRLLDSSPGLFLVEKAEQPGGPTWRVSMVHLEPEEIPGPPPPRMKIVRDEDLPW